MSHRMGHARRMMPLAGLAWLGVSSAVLATSGTAQAQRTVAVDASPIRHIASDEAFARVVTVRVDAVSLKRAVDMLASNANVRIQYRAELLDAVTTPITLHVTRVSLGAALDQVLAGTQLQAVPLSEDLVTIKPVVRSLVQEQGSVIGRVTNGKTKQPIVGATVLLDDATKGVITGEDGSYRIAATAGAHRVVVRAVGFNRTTQQVTVTAGASSTLDFVIEPSASVLNEVIVTGTVVATERKAIPTPITVISAEDIEKRGITRIDQLFRGEVPGVVSLDFGIQRYDANTLGAMASTKVYTRGSASLTGSANPLKTYVDGVELLDPQYLGTIDPKSIERIEIITGPQAATIYGSGAMGGVMQIFTKKGSGRSTPDVTLSLKYGMLESSLATGKAAAHNHSIMVTGGTGPAFSYSVNGSYGYTGQWQPMLFNRNYGLQAGATYRQGALTATGSVSSTSGENGTAYSTNAPYVAAKRITGEWAVSTFNVFIKRQTRSTSVSQTAGLNVDYSMSSIWQHHLNIGTSQMNFDLLPDVPLFLTPSDSLYTNRGSNGRRTSMSYNTTLVPPMGRVLSATMTLGATGSSGRNIVYGGTTPSPTSSSWTGTTVTSTIGDESYGGFATARVGVFDRLFLTASVRGEHNPTYGNKHAIDWTPTTGAAYTMEYGDLTIKSLISYGRSTRAPNPSYRLPVIYNYPNYEPTQVMTQIANAELTPEYERGPQGGLEIYYGNWGSLTVNHYQQTVTDLILPIEVGRVPYVNLTTSDTGSFSQQQYVNVAKMRQKGWEGTGSLNLGPLSLKGTYSWNDSRIVAMSPKYTSTYVRDCRDDGLCYAVFYTIGAPFQGIPAHTASTTTSYAWGGTSVSLVTNWIGATTRRGTESSKTYDQVNERIRVYSGYFRQVTLDFTQPGYVKADLSASQRLSGWITATLNVTNLANSFYGEGSHIYPTLGRRTDLGLSMRFPRTR